MQRSLSLSSRILVAFASGTLITTFFLPVWRIDLLAPQYPEGLTMKIWINGLSGDVDIINGLNHYIGMKHITEGMFPEFTFLPFIVGFFLILGMLVAWTGSPRLLLLYVLLSIAGGIAAMVDFYQWGYNYGHQLDPSAPIQVPGLSYQPPLLGHKRLLNFDAWSMPDVGGWLVILAGTIFFTVWCMHWWKHRKRKQRPVGLPFTTAVLLLLSSCQSGPSAWEPGNYACDFCRMTIMDDRFGASLLTKQGREYRFDDLQCMVRFNNAGAINPKQIRSIWVLLYESPGEFVEVENACFAIDSTLRTPMGSHAAAFAAPSGAAGQALRAQPVRLTWEQLKSTWP